MKSAATALPCITLHLQPGLGQRISPLRGWAGYTQSMYSVQSIHETFLLIWKLILTRFNQNNLHSHNEIKIFEQYQNMEKPQCVI